MIKFWFLGNIFSETNLTGSDTFPQALIKCAKQRFNLKKTRETD